ncbi:MAG: competence/damage-inducible protein A [Gemella sp.]|nr:competence/damage-inducible protein A [Gemella sp.]
MKVELISVGTEILLGDILNTNVQFLSKELASLGINVYKHTSVGDNKERFLNVIDTAFKEADTLIITGGLGPTDDDITKETVSEYFGLEEEVNEYYWKKIQDYLLNYSSNKTVTKNDQKTARVPIGAKTFENFWGTAPGILVEQDNKKVILLPGPPREMTNMFKTHIKPYLESLSSQVFLSKYIRFFGIGESLLEDKIKNLMDRQTNPTLALYAKSGEVLLRVTASASTKEECQELLNASIKEVKAIVGDYIYLIGDESVAESQSEMNKVLANVLIDNNISISIAESITGGLVASSLIESDGISKVLKESYVTYSDEAKHKLLDVQTETLEKHTAVSKQVAEEMLKGLVEKTNIQAAIITTGYANHEEKNLAGLVYIGAYYKGKSVIKEVRFSGDRNRVRFRTSQEAMNELRKLILE